MAFPKTKGLERVREVFSSELLKVHERIEKLEGRRDELEGYLRALDGGLEIVRKVEQLELPLDEKPKTEQPACDHWWQEKSERAKGEDGVDVDRPYWHCSLCLKVLFYDPAHAHEFEEVVIKSLDGAEEMVQQCKICKSFEADLLADDADDDDDENSDEQLELPSVTTLHAAPEMTDALGQTA